MRILGIDFGTKRIGVAVGETSPALAMPLVTVDGTDRPRAAHAVALIAAEEGAEAIVVGMPTSLDGRKEGESAEAARQFATMLADATGLRVEFEDERLTTAYAERMRREAGLPKRGFDRDASAAAALLQTYLERTGTDEAGDGRVPET